MPEDNKSKVRIRFQNGAEFEAEGSQAFIEQQRNYFLTLIGQPSKAPTKADLPSVITNDLSSSQPEVPFTQNGGINTPNPRNSFIWERLMREDGKYVYFRKKLKTTPAQSAELLLAGARILLNKNRLSALELAYCLKASNISLPTRLDRVLGGEIQQGYLICEGIKRSRTYQLTESGFAHIFVLAEKLVGEN